MTQKSRRAPRSIVEVIGEVNDVSSSAGPGELGRAMYAAAHPEEVTGIRRKSPFRTVADHAASCNSSPENVLDESQADPMRSQGLPVG